MSFFSRIKGIFSRKKKTEESSPAPEQVPEPIEQKVEEKKEEQPKENLRKEKLCEHCGAPNDDFVKKCWLCKRDI